ncbi:hypothetical protein DDE05_41385, partial [Streptomyces cavourensis]
MAAHDDDINRGIRPARGSEDPAGQVAYLEQEIAVLRRKLADSPRHTRILEERIVELQTNLAGVSAQNERLANTLREARDQIVALKEEVDRLAQPPAGFGVFLQANEDGTCDIFTGGRKLRVNVSPSVELEDLRRGQEVMLNEALNVVEAMEFERAGDIVTLKEILEDGERALVVGHTDEERVVRLAEPLLDITIRPGDALLLDSRSGYVYEVVPKSEVEELVLEEVPDIDYDKIGGLGDQIELIRDAVELPYLHPDLFKEHELRPPKGILLYGPPGCGKTLIAKAVANSLAKKVAEVTGQPAGKSYFLNIKGPELLNKYVGETERHIRLVFQRAREKASEGTPVIVFFDEMESLFRTRGSGVSSDVENTIVPQLLAEIDGVEGLENVIVIGASNRFAHAAAVAVAEAPAKAYNPLFIYGESGLGKTHLLHAIGHYARSLYPGTRVRYVSSEEFTNEFINSIRDGKGDTFRKRYRDVDILLVDDIQFLASKESTQEEFFHTFNTLHNANKQIVLSSDRPPKQLVTLEDRLRNRFEWGLTTDVQPPELETRIAILRKKAVQEQLNAPPEVLEFIASRISRNIRELEGALIRVTAFASLNRQPVDLGLTEIV